MPNPDRELQKGVPASPERDSGYSAPEPTLPVIPHQLSPVTPSPDDLFQDTPSLTLPPIKLTSKPLSLLEDIRTSIPTGLESHRILHYQIAPQVKKGEIKRNGKGTARDLVVLKLYVPEELESKLAAWRKDIEQRHPSADIVVHRSSTANTAWNQIRHRFRKNPLITKDDVPAIQSMIKELCGSPPPRVVAPRPDRPQRVSLEHIPFVAIDREGTIDREDLLHAEKKSPNHYVLWVAIVDVTDYITPGDRRDDYAKRVARTTYGRRRAISPLGEELFHGFGSFGLNETRPAWVIETDITIDPSGRVETVQPKIIRAMVKNHGNFDPSFAYREEHGHPRAANFIALSEVANILEQYRKSKTSIVRLDGEGPLTKIVAESMIRAKHHLARFMIEKTGLPAIYRVHQRPSTETANQLCSDLAELQIAVTEEDLRNPQSFTRILKELEQKTSHRARSLANQLLDTFLIHSHFSGQPGEHYGLGLPEAYMELKARDYSGLINQYQLDAFDHQSEGLDQNYVASCAQALNDREWSLDERYYKLNLYEMLEGHLSDSDTITLGAVTKRTESECFIDVPGFSHWGVIRDGSASSRATDEILAVKLQGFNYDTKRFEFTVVTPEDCLRQSTEEAA
jgi:exoribonuclease R